MSELYISVDVETDGPIPGPYSMVSFGAAMVCIQHADGRLERLDSSDPANQFYAELRPISEDWLPAALEVSGLSREHLLAEGQDPAAVMAAFNRWVAERSEALGAVAPIFAAYPLGFDWMFLYWYLIKFTGFSPFGHSRHVDMKTFYKARANWFVRLTHAVKAKMPKFLLSRKRHTHNGLHDAIEQGELLVNLLLWNGARTQD